MFEPNIDFDPELLLMPYGGSPRARIPLVAPKTPQEETRDTVGVAPNVELRKQPAVTPVTPITPATTQTSVTPEFKSVAPKPTPVTPPNREGKPVSAGEFIPEPTAVAPKPVAPTTPERSVGLQKRIDDIDAGVTYASSSTPTERAAIYAAPQKAEISQGYRLLSG